MTFSIGSNERGWRQAPADDCETASEARPGGRQPAGTFRIATTPYLNSAPLVAGLAESGRATIHHAAPSELAGVLADGLADAVLLPAIDLGRSAEPLCVLPAGCIAASGQTFAARIFSHVPPEELAEVWVDYEARSSVALAQILWRERFQQDLVTLPFDPAGGPAPSEAAAVLVVGDRVVAQPPIGFDRQIDLGAMWFEMTGLPMVLSVWATRWDPQCCGPLHAILQRARKRGQRRLEQIARTRARDGDWPEDLAVRYLTEIMEFEFTEDHREGLEEFLDRAAECGLIDGYRAPRYYAPPAPVPSVGEAE